MAGAGAKPALSRREGKEITRRRLINGAIEIMRSEGVAAATTGRIAGAAGIAQSSFYGHFADRDECLQAAAEVIGNHVLRRVREQLSRHQPADVRGSIRAVYESVLEQLVSSPELTRIFLRYRGDDSSPLGRAFGDLVDRARVDLQKGFRRYGAAGGVVANAEVYADLIINATLGAVDSLLSGRIGDRAAALDTLTDVTHAALTSVLARKA